MGSADAPSRPINLWRKPMDRFAPAVYDRLDSIQEEVEQHENRSRKRDGTSAGKFRRSLRALCLDLFCAYVADVELQVGVPRDNSALDPRKDLDLPEFISARTFLAALDGLIATGHVEQLSLGNEARSRRTRVRGTKKLVDQVGVGELRPRDLIDTSDTIILRVGPKGRKKRIPFADTPEIRSWRSNLERINDLLSEYDITLDVAKPDLFAMEAERLEKARQQTARDHTRLSYQRIDTTRVRLYRVFNSPDFTEGGRFYGGWWQSVPSRFRKHIQINGKLTCEYDYSSIHPRLLYQQVGLPLSLDVDPYDGVFDGKHRKAVKRAFNAMLNAKRLPDPVQEFSEQATGMTWVQFTDAILDYHKPLKKFMNTGEGLRLQRLDADIAEAVMLRLAKMGYPCLPIHDSFITFKSLEDELPEYMLEATKQFGAGLVPTKQSYSAEYKGPTGLVTEDIGTILSECDIRDR